MTVLLVLLFLIIALGADAVIQHKRQNASRLHVKVIKGTVQEIFEHGDGICPTMADGGKKVK